MNCWFPEIPFTLNLCNLSIKGFTISKQRRRSTVTLGEKSLFLYILCLSYPFLRKPVDIITNFTNQRRVSTDIIDQWEERDLLVIEHDVRSPDVVAGHVQHLHPYKINEKIINKWEINKRTSVLLRVPLQLVVAPVLLHPQVCRHDLVLQILIIRKWSLGSFCPIRYVLSLKKSQERALKLYKDLEWDLNKGTVKNLEKGSEPQWRRQIDRDCNSLSSWQVKEYIFVSYERRGKTLLLKLK